MHAVLGEIEEPEMKGEPLDHAVGLLCQQAWCWGQDILTTSRQLVTRYRIREAGAAC